MDCACAVYTKYAPREQMNNYAYIKIQLNGRKSNPQTEEHNEFKCGFLVAYQFEIVLITVCALIKNLLAKTAATSTRKWCVCVCGDASVQFLAVPTNFRANLKSTVYSV